MKRKKRIKKVLGAMTLAFATISVLFMTSLCTLFHFLFPEKPRTLFQHLILCVGAAVLALLYWICANTLQNKKLVSDNTFGFFTAVYIVVNGALFLGSLVVFCVPIEHLSWIILTYLPCFFAAFTSQR